MGLQKWMTVVSMGVATLCFIWTTNPRELIAGLVYLRIPYRYAWGLFIILRYVPAFESELIVIKDAQRVRGIKQGSGISGQLEIWKRYTLPLFVSMATKARAIAIAMDCRCFGVSDKRVFRDPFRWSLSGILMLILMVLLIVVEIAFFGAIMRRTITF